MFGQPQPIILTFRMNWKTKEKKKKKKFKQYNDHGMSSICVSVLCAFFCVHFNVLANFYVCFVFGVLCFLFFFCFVLQFAIAIHSFGFCFGDSMHCLRFQVNWILFFCPVLSSYLRNPFHSSSSSSYFFIRCIKCKIYKQNKMRQKSFPSFFVLFLFLFVCLEQNFIKDYY